MMMTPNDDPPRDDAVDDLLRRVGAALERLDDGLAWQDEVHLQWLAEELRLSQKRAQQARDADDAVSFAEELIERRAIQAARDRFPARELRYREAPTVARIAEAVPMAGAERCAAVLDLAAAAGVGRELWDDPCDTWLELPLDIGNGRHVAIRVEGDSMEPVLMSGDLILVKLDAVPVVDDLVLARRPNAGFVVKRVSAITPQRVELSSFNRDYAPFAMRRGATSLIGVVVARFSRR